MCYWMYFMLAYSMILNCLLIIVFIYASGFKTFKFLSSNTHAPPPPTAQLQSDINRKANNFLYMVMQKQTWYIYDAAVKIYLRAVACNINIVLLSRCQLQLLGAVCLLVSWKVRSHKVCIVHYENWSRIHERTISLRFLGIILRVSAYNV